MRRWHKFTVRVYCCQWLHGVYGFYCNGVRVPYRNRENSAALWDSPRVRDLMLCTNSKWLTCVGKIAKNQFISRSKCGGDVGNCLFKVPAPLGPNCHHIASKRNSWQFSAKVWHLLPPLAPHSVLVTWKKLYGRSLCLNQIAVSFVFIFIIRPALTRGRAFVIAAGWFHCVGVARRYIHMYLVS